jgi:FkbH-like protein
MFWRTAHERLNCQIVQNNFDTPPWRALDNYEMRHPATLSRFIAETNRLLAERAPGYVTIHDVEALEVNAGRRAWANERFFLHAKMPCAPEYLVEYAHSVASIVAAQRGLSKKCLVLDLDNTLWGGVIGDDGMRGIRIGQGDAEAEGFTAFQRYCKLLASRGVILAVCSKNTDAIAREVFEKHPDMVLRMDDIACFVANWSDKAANLRHIAKTLNIGLDSLVFVDDNPAERSIIRHLVPEVAVPEVSTDPIDFIEALERHRYFQVATLGAEDFKRTEYYRANAARAEVASSSGGVEGFLQQLDMRATIGAINDATLERSTQLVNKSNQFNLTTRRKTVAEVLLAMTAPDWVTLTVTLADRFGDNGLISVLLANVDGDTLDIDTWVMSCRVLKRGVERFLLNALVEKTKAMGLKSIRGTYIPTAKNDIVREHYRELGFHNVETGSDGRTIWQLCVSDFAHLANNIRMD